ncbi:MAG TPA: DUF3566 domain-containing protein [Bacillota bacterium]|nr:DUF3566 domain-containing protein [Bacillota bacterium]
MKSFEVKQIGLGSVFKFHFVVGVVVGLIASILLLLTGASLKNLGIEVGTVVLGKQGPLQVGAALTGIVLGSLAYGLMMGLFGAIGALLYNVFARITGGIVVRLGDRD